MNTSCRGVGPFEIEGPRTSARGSRHRRPTSSASLAEYNALDGSWTKDGIDVFSLYQDDPGTDTEPFYRCFLTGPDEHFYTSDPNCEVGLANATNEGIMGYIATSQLCGNAPLFRLVNAETHFFTKSPAERDAAISAGFTLESTVGYVW